MGSLVASVIGSTLLALTLIAAHVNMEWYGWFTSGAFVGLLFGYIYDTVKDK